jgi:hypothetical protein
MLLLVLLLLLLLLLLLWLLLLVLLLGMPGVESGWLRGLGAREGGLSRGREGEIRVAD